MEQAQLGPHIDPFTAQVSAAIYLDEVGTHAGGFTIWPGSAQLLYKTMRQHRNFTPTEDFGAAMQHIKDTIVPIEFSGSPGDVILYHHLAVRVCKKEQTVQSNILAQEQLVASARRPCGRQFIVGGCVCCVRVCVCARVRARVRVRGVACARVRACACVCSCTRQASTLLGVSVLVQFTTSRKFSLLGISLGRQQAATSCRGRTASRKCRSLMAQARGCHPRLGQQRLRRCRLGLSLSVSVCL